MNLVVTSYSSDSYYMLVGGVTISSTDIVPACSGDDLQLTCNMPGRVLEWTISLMPPEDMMFKYVLDSVQQPFPVHTITVSNISFTFSRISPPNSRPLITRLLISPATSVVNGTIVVCADRETRTNSSTRVYIINCKLL